MYRSRLSKVRTKRSSDPVVVTASSAQERLLETNEREDTSIMMGMTDMDKRTTGSSILAEEGVFRAIAEYLREVGSLRLCVA